MNRAHERCAGGCRFLSSIVLLLAPFAGLLHCSSDSSATGPAAGSERGPCYGNGTCDPGLECRSGLCVAGSDASTGTGGSSTGGGAGAGGAVASGGASGNAGASGASSGGSAGSAGSAGASGHAGAGGAAGSDAGDAAPEGGTECNPVAQTGCGTGQRCTWVVTATGGHVACLADGTVSAGGACTLGAPGETTGFDDCKAGLGCIKGACLRVCDSSQASACATNSSCVTYGGIYGTSTTEKVGFCTQGCDPLTQTVLGTGAAACGSPNAASPTLGCYGMPGGSFTCSNILDSSKVQGSDPVLDPQSGFPYSNSCAPGFEPILTKSTNDTRPICVALCKPGVTSQANPANAQGLVGATGLRCPDKTGSGISECRYWWYMEDTTKPGFPDASGNTLGFCIDYTQYQYDSDGRGTMVGFPSCTTLSDTAHNFDPTLTDNVFWGCAPYP